MLSASMLMSSPNGDCLATISYSSNSSLKTQDSALIAAGPRHGPQRKHGPNSSLIVVCVSIAAITLQRSLFTESLQINGCYMAAYFAVVT
jgi:hypothetical protein